MSTENEGSTETPENSPPLSLPQIQTLLKTKDDTSRFTGLALLKSVLDNSQAIRQDEDTVIQLWSSISPRFLDRLIKTGTKNRSGSGKDAREMLSLAVSVIHTFSSLLPDHTKSGEALVGRVPSLMNAILQSSGETTQLILQALVSITSTSEGATAFMSLEDISPLTEAAPAHPEALQVLSFAWLHAQNASRDPAGLRDRINSTIQQLVSSFRGTDGVTLLEFLGSFLHHADPQVIPRDPKWLEIVISFIRRLVTSRPTPEARHAYTTLSASLLQAYPARAPYLLFSSTPSEEKSLPYLLTNLVLIDIRSTCPTLLTALNSPSYAATSRRLAAGYDLVSSFIGFLLRSLDDEDAPLIMDPDLLLKLRKSLAETISVTVEYLRDRWDASVAGAMGLHPDARPGTVHASSGSHLTLAWDSADDAADDDPLVLAAVRAVALWIREDESTLLRKEASGLLDMLLELYSSSKGKDTDARLSVLVALEGILGAKDGKEKLLDNNGWDILASDLLDIFRRTATESDEAEAARGIEIVRVLLQVIEAEGTGTREAWMDMITHVAGWYPPETEQPAVVRECQLAVLQLCADLLIGAGPGMRKRYVHSTSAIFGIAGQLREGIRGEALRGQMQDVLDTLGSLR